MTNLLPSSVHRWSVSEPPRTYSGRQIFEYMDGAGEVYLAYGFRDLLVQRFASSGEEEILVELFDMGEPRNAFGVFTHMQGRGPALPLGQGAEYKSGLLCFWKGRYFACVSIERETPDAKEAVLALGEAIAGTIREEGKRPEILRYLPAGQFAETSLRYFFREEILNSHFYVADRNLLRMGGETEGALVRMVSDQSYLLLLRYPGPEQADSARASFLTHYLHDAGEAGAARTENGKWTACAKQGAYLSIVFDAASREQAARVLHDITGRLP